MTSPTPVTAAPPDAPLVSIVVPVYNRARLVGRALESALAQTYRQIELVVVDDGSTDDLGAALVAVDDERLRLVTHPVNRGAAAARNTGIAESRGEYVAFLDSDDWWLPEKLARQVAAMRGQPAEVAGHACGYEYLKPGRPPEHIAPAWTATNFCRAQFYGCTFGPGTTLLCRRDVFAAVGPFDVTLRRFEDWDWMLRLAAAGYRLLASPEVLARVETGSRPGTADVEAALARLDERHAAAIRRNNGAAASRIFRSSLYLELAGARFRDAQYARAIGWIGRTLLAWPLRGATFYRRLLRYAATPGRVRAANPGAARPAARIGRAAER